MKAIKKILSLALIIFFVGCTPQIPQIPIKKEPKKPEVIIKKEPPKQPKEQEPKEVVIKPEPVETKQTLALVFPSTDIDRYALEATNTLNAYLLNRDKPFTFETFDMKTQSKQNILNIFKQLQEKQITKVVLLITKQYVNMLQDVPNLSQFEIVLPLINQYEQTLNDALLQPNILFGSISYRQQFQQLVSYAQKYPLVEFYDNSSIGDTLHSYVKEHHLQYSKMIDDNNGRYREIFKYRKNKIQNSALILNTPIVKSSILLSAATAEELEIPMVLSTQLNYTPLLFSLTQVADRKNLIIASSIGTLSSNLREFNILVGNNILYNWVNYSCIIAAEYLLNKNIDQFSDLSIKDRQIIYPVRLYDVQSYSFKEL